MASASISVIDHPEPYSSFGMSQSIRPNYHRHHHSQQTVPMNPPTSVASSHARSLSLAQPAIADPPPKISPPSFLSASRRRKTPTPTGHRVGAGASATLPAFSFPQAPAPALTAVESVPGPASAQSQDNVEKQMRYDETDEPEEARKEIVEEQTLAPRGSDIVDGSDSLSKLSASVSSPTSTTSPVRRRLPHSSLPAFSFPQAPAPTTEDDDKVTGLKERCFSNDELSYTHTSDSPFFIPSRSHAHSRSRSHIVRNRRQPSVPLPAFSFPQAPASDIEGEPTLKPETSYEGHESDEYPTQPFTSTSVSSPTTSAISAIAEEPALPPLFSSADCNVTPPSTSHSAASSNVSPFTSPQSTHKRQPSRRHQHTSSISISQPPPRMRPIAPPQSAITPIISPGVSAARRHSHRRSAAMSGIDGDAAAALAGLSSGTTSPVSVASRPGSAATANIPQIILSGATPVSATPKTGDEQNSPSLPQFQWNAAQGALSSPLSTISSEGSITSGTCAADIPISSPPSSPAQNMRPKSASFAQLSMIESGGASDKEVRQSQLQSHRRVQSTTLERSESGSTQRTIKAGDRRSSSTESQRERPVSSSNAKSKAMKKPKKDRPWAGILTRKSKKKQVAGNKKQQQPPLPSSQPQSQSQSEQTEHQTKQESCSATPASAQTLCSDYPPPSSITTSEPTLTRDNSISDDSSDIDINFDDDHTIVIQSSDEPDEYNSSTTSTAATSTPTVSSFESAWKPRSFYEQGRQLNNDENPFSPIIDLDAALGPFQTPEVNESGSGFSYATKHMHSGRGRRNEFLSPENRHRRSESAPLTGPPSPEQVRTSPISMAMQQYSAAAIFKTPDVFDEEEEDKFLAGTTGQEESTPEVRREDGDATDSAEQTAGKEEKKSTSDDGDDTKSIKSFKSLSGLRRPGLSRHGRLPPGGRSLRIDTSRAVSPYKAERSESITSSLNESENVVSPINIGRPLNSFPPSRIPGTATASTSSPPADSVNDETQDQPIESPPELFSPTPKSQHTSIFSSPSTSTFSIAENSRSSTNVAPQNHRNSNGSLLLARKEYADSPVEYSGTPPPLLPFANTTATFDLPYDPSPSSSSTFCSSAMTSRHSQSRFLPPTGTSTPTSATESIDHRRSMTNESMSMSGSPSMPSPTLRPGSRSRHKRSSIVSLSKLITASHATERNRASLDGRLSLSSVGGSFPSSVTAAAGGSSGGAGVGPVGVNDGVAGASSRRVSCDTYRTYKERREAGLPTASAATATAARQPKSHRISRLMQFWRTRDKDGRGHA